MNDPMLQQAFQSWQELSSTKEQRLQYEGRLKRLLDEEAAIREAELRVERALKQGLEQGKKERDIEIVTTLIQSGMDNIFIQKITKLPVEVIEQIRADVSL